MSSRVRVDLGDRGYDVVSQAEIRRPGPWRFICASGGGPGVEAA